MSEFILTYEVVVSVEAESEEKAKEICANDDTILENQIRHTYKEPSDFDVI